jgi:hypothetical protein
MKVSNVDLETSMPATGSNDEDKEEEEPDDEEGSCCMVASLPCGCELLGREAAAFNRLFGLARRGLRRSGSVTVL